MKRSIYKFNNFFSAPAFLEMPSFGLDIADDSIKFMQLLSTRRGIEIGKYGERKIEEGIIELGKIKDPLKLEEVLNELKKENNIKDARVSLLENQIYSFKLVIDKNTKSIRESIELSLEDHIPIPASETIFDFDILEETENEIIVEVGAIQQETVEEYLAVFKNCDIRVHSFELEAQALARSLIKKEDKNTYMIVDFGAKRTGIFIISQGVPLFTSTIDFGGDLFSEMIQKSLSISFKEAEDIKIKYGLQRNLKNKDIFPILLNSASILKDEIQKHFIYWHTHEDENGKKNPSIQKILFCGGNSNIIGLVDYFAISLKVDAEIANVWINICEEKDRVPSIPSKIALSFATALGLALKDFYND